MRHDDRFNLASVIDPSGRSFDYSYDREGNLTEIVNPLGHKTRFAYEPQFQRLSQMLDAQGNPTRYDYDPRGNLRAITDAAGKAENWGHDALGNPTTWTNRRRNAIDYQFHPTNGFLMAKLYPDGSRATYEYDPRGNLIAASNYTGRINLDYFPTNDRLKRITYPGGRWLDYTYNASGRRATMTDHLGYQLRYEYDPLGRLRSITNSENVRLVRYDYDPEGCQSLKTLGNGVYTSYSYDTVGRLEKLTNALPKGSVLSFFNYSYDERGRRTAMDTHYGQWNCGYDDLGQLTNAVLVSTDPQMPNRNLTYLYDATGNRVRTIENGVTTIYTANNSNQYTQVGGKTCAFDDDGNLIQEASNAGVSTFIFDYENRLVGAATNSTAWEYAYDALGNLVGVTDNGTSRAYLIDPAGFGNVVAQYDDAGVLMSREIHGAGLIAFDSGHGEDYLTFDPLGNAHEIIGTSGNVLSRQAYDPFGRAHPLAGDSTSRFQSGGEFGVVADASGLHYMRARAYRTDFGRFCSIDPIGLLGGAMNLYEYGRNNPLSFIDPTGLYIIPDSGSVGPRQLTGTGRAIIITGGIVAGVGVIAFTAYVLVPVAIASTVVVAATVVAVQNAIVTASIAAVVYAPAIIKVGEWASRQDPARLGRTITELPNTLTRMWNEYIQPWFDQRDQFIRVLTDQAGRGFSEADSKILIPIYASDPNQKLAYTGVGALNHIQPNTFIPYRIDFENETNATAPAQAVFVTNQLTNTLDWQSFELTENGFGDERIMLPPQTQHFETNLPVTLNSVTFIVQSQAGIRLDTGEVFCTFRSLNPETDSPPPATIGFLPPEDGTGRGQGFVSFIIRPKPSLPTGAEIRNVAIIDFDGREAIATDQVDPHNPSAGIDTNKQARVTIDAGAPISSVASLPSESGRSFWMQWSGQDDAGGSGIANYDVYVSTNGSPFGLWLAATAGNSNVFRGELGASYAFYTRARDPVGNLQSAPPFADAQTIVSTNSPLLAGLDDAAILPGQSLSVTNMVEGTPLGTFLFSLGPNPPGGFSINVTNGTLQWTPGCSQGNTTNVIQVWVADSARPHLMDMASLTVTVDTCVQPSLGQVVLLAGDSGKLPINLISRAALTNLQATLLSPPGRLLNFSIEPIVPEICSNSVTLLANQTWRLELIVCPDQSLTGTQQVAWLHFKAADLSSDFVGLSLTNLVGYEANGSPVANFAPQSGRVVVVSEEPLLECVYGTNGQPLLILYGKTGPGYIIETRTNLVDALWQTVITNLTMTNLWREIMPPASSSPVNLFRALRPTSVAPRRNVGVSMAGGTNFVLTAQVLANRSYNIQATPSLTSPIWQTITTTLSGNDGRFTFTNTWSATPRGRFYRVAEAD